MKNSVKHCYNYWCCSNLSDKSQIKALYKDSAGILLANCDTLLFLGGTDPEVKKFISESLGKQTIWKKSSSVTRGKSGSSSQSSKRRTWM